MTPEQKQEELSKAYLYAVTAACGFATANWSQDQSCIDVTIAVSGVLGEGHLADPKLDIQLKCTTSQKSIRGKFIPLQIERRQYDRLVAKCSTPKILIVLVLPEDRSIWVSHTVEQLVLRRCAYYLITTGLGKITTESKVLHVPMTNIFSPTALEGMMGKLSRGEPL